MRSEPYRQALPDLKLSIERYTDAVPHDGAFYVLRAGEVLGRYRSLKSAQVAWRELLDNTGWTPASLESDPSDALRREKAERWSRNRAG